MDKIKINNQVVIMRKHVKQAKVHVINKLTKEVKLLQNRKGDEKQVAKAKRKAERFLEEISLLKKIKPDSVSKLALCKTKDWKKVLQEKNSSLEDRCFAMLANYDPVQKEVQKFCSSNSNLIPRIPDFIKEWEEKSKFPKKSTKNMKQQNNNHGVLFKEKCDPSTTSKKANKRGFDKKLSVCDKESEENMNYQRFNSETKLEEVEQEMEIKSHDEIQDKNVCVPKTQLLEVETLITNNRDDMLEQSSENEDPSSECTDNEMKLERFDNLKNNLQTESLKNNSFDDDKDDECSESSVDMDNEAKTVNPTNENAQVLNKVFNSTQTVLGQCTSAKHDLKAITILNLDELQGLEEIPVNHSLKNEVYESEQEEAAFKLEGDDDDPFFLRGTESYPQQTNSFDFSKIHPDNLPFMSIDGKHHKKDFKHSYNQKHSFKREFQRPLNSSHYFSSKSGTDANFKERKSNFKDYKARKQPEGKRFKRNEFYQSSSNKLQREPNRTHISQSYKRDSDDMYLSKFKYEKRGNISQKKQKTKNDDANKPLHPSWEAKKKQKELIKTPFQGKRVVFND